MKQSNFHYNWLQEEHGIPLRPEKTRNIYPKDVSIRLQELREGILGSRQISLEGYREAVRRWPNNPDAKLMLIGALFQRKMEEEAREWLKTALREHPDNIYVVHASIQFCDTHAEALNLGPIHGPNFSILDFPTSEDDTYTLAEFEAFETSLIDYYTLTHNLAAAKARLNRLLAFGFTEEDLHEQFTFLFDVREEYYLNRNAHELANRVLVPGRRQVKLLGLEKPSLHHVELECLYALPPEDMSEAKLEELLTLPRESLLADLRAILRDGLERYDEIVEANLPDEALFFPIHAIRLLGILRATETLPEILDYLRMEEGFFDFWFGDFADRFILPALYFLSKDQLPLLFNYMKEPGHHAFNRVWVEELPVQVLLHEPTRRDEVVLLYKDLLEFLLTTQLDEVVDTYFITSLTVPVTMTKAPELLPVVRKLYHRGLIEDSMMGNLEKIERAFEEGASNFEVMALPQTPFEFYSLAHRERQRELLSAKNLSIPPEPTAADLILARLGEEEEKRRNKILEKKLARPKTTKKKVGRNDPCPCGSGRKYKKCCLRTGV